MQRLLLGFVAAALAFAAPVPGLPLPDLNLPGWEPALVKRSVGGLLLMAGCVVVAARVLPCRTGWMRPGTGAGAVRRWLPLLGGVLCGLTWSGVCHWAALDSRLPANSDGALGLSVRLESAPESVVAGVGRPPAARFQARIVAAEAAPRRLVGRCLRLSWYDPPACLARGQIWRVQAIVKRPWSYANPGGFDYERWLLGARIDGTGWIRGGELLLDPAPSRLAGIRGRLAAAVEAAPLQHPGLLLALLLGRAGGVPEPVWDLLRATGTVHLMVVSGLHVSLAAAAGMMLAGWLVRLAPQLPLWLNARQAGCLGGGLAATAYAVVAGAGLPAVRALLMAGAGLLLLCGGRSRSAGAALLLVLAAVLLVEPLAVHRQGFWLSFAAVAVLIVCFARPAGGGRWRAAVAAQLGLSVGLLPLVAVFTGSLPWTGLAANLLAVPALTLAVVPLTLAGGLAALAWQPAAAGLWALADRALAGILIWLQWLGGLPAATAAGGTGALLAAQLAGLWWLLRPVPARRLLVLMCAVLPLAPRLVALPHGAFRVLALDVGQGTAVLVDTRRHRLLYDTGPRYPGGFETGSAVVVPSLLATGPPRLDTLILSHDDLDHTGGAAAVQAALAPRRVLGGPATPAADCHGKRWAWDGVRFEVLRIVRPPDADDNDASCILRVDDGRYSLLIAGDISRRVEASLVRTLAAGGRRVDLLFAPHHGSGTSSSRSLVRVARPALVFVSAGHDNRFGHPHPDVVRRYADVGAPLLITGREGALMWDSAHPDEVTRWRRDHGPYWRAQVPEPSRR